MLRISFLFVSMLAMTGSGVQAAIFGTLPGELYVSADDSGTQGTERDDANLIRVATNSSECEAPGICIISTELEFCQGQKYTFWWNPDDAVTVESVELELFKPGVLLHEICENKNPYTLYANNKANFQHGNDFDEVSGYNLRIGVFPVDDCVSDVAIPFDFYFFEVVNCANPANAVNPQSP